MMAKKKTKLPIIKQPKISDEWLNFLWSVAIKARAGFKDEISGETDCDLQAHHLIGKANKILRWIVLENGISISIGRHKFGAHGSQSRQEDFRQAVKKLRGKDIFDQLYLYKNKVEKIVKSNVEAFLLGQIAEHNEALVNWYQTKSYKTKSVRDNYEKLFRKLAESKADQ